MQYGKTPTVHKHIVETHGWTKVPEGTLTPTEIEQLPGVVEVHENFDTYSLEICTEGLGAIQRSTLRDFLQPKISPGVAFTVIAIDNPDRVDGDVAKFYDHDNYELARFMGINEEGIEPWEPRLPNDPEIDTRHLEETLERNQTRVDFISPDDNDTTPSVKDVKQMYVNGEIDEIELELKLEAALEDEEPFVIPRP